MRRPTLHPGEFGNTLRYRDDDYALITERDGALYCWRCRIAHCLHINDLTSILPHLKEDAK